MTMARMVGCITSCATSKTGVASLSITRGQLATSSTLITTPAFTSAATWYIRRQPETTCSTATLLCLVACHLEHRRSATLTTSATVRALPLVRSQRMESVQTSTDEGRNSSPDLERVSGLFPIRLPEYGLTSAC